jgi:hypothetical protein
MGSKRQMTAAKMARERDVKEKRLRKQERRAERKRAAAELAEHPERFVLDADGNVVARREVSDTPVGETESDTASAASAEPVVLAVDPA